MRSNNDQRLNDKDQTLPFRVNRPEAGPSVFVYNQVNNTAMFVPNSSTRVQSLIIHVAMVTILRLLYMYKFIYFIKNSVFKLFGECSVKLHEVFAALAVLSIVRS